MEHQITPLGVKTQNITLRRIAKSSNLKFRKNP